MQENTRRYLHERRIHCSSEVEELNPQQMKESNLVCRIKQKKVWRVSERELPHLRIG